MRASGTCSSIPDSYRTHNRMAAVEADATPAVAGVERDAQAAGEDTTPSQPDTIADRLPFSPLT